MPQLPFMHTRPAPHAFAAQQGWLGPPQAAGVSHTIPAPQVSPEAHWAPVQQGCRLPPQAMGAEQRSRSQTRPAWQVEPGQQAPFAAPHELAASHCPP